MTNDRATKGKWDEYWNSYWIANEEATKYSPAQAFRRRLVLRALSPGVGAKILDIGSGQGDFALDLSLVHPECRILGLELSKSGVEISREKVPNQTFQIRDLTTPSDPAPEHRKWATHATCCEVLEHIHRPDEFLANVRPYLAVGCKLVVTVPGGPMSAFDRHIGHVRHYSPSDLAKLLTGAGFAIEHLSGSGFPFFNLYRLMVILRGKRLIHDVASSDPKSVSLMVRVGAKVFSILFKLNWPIPFFGWQTIAVARVI